MDFLGHDDLYKSIKLWGTPAKLTLIASFPGYPEKCMINAEFAQRHGQLAVLKWTKLDKRSFFGKLGLRLRRTETWIMVWRITRELESNWLALSTALCS